MRAKEKRPFENEWQNTPYKIDDPKLKQHLLSGGNYGVISGVGGVVVLDVDDVEKFKSKVDLRKFPQTLQVKTGGGGYHFYFSSPGIKEKIVLKNSGGEHLGELQAGGAQAVGPGCVHPNGNLYEIIQDCPIATISDIELLQVLSPVIPKRKSTLDELQETVDVARRGRFKNDDPFADVSILDVIDTDNFTKSGEQLQGPHPVHGSTTGHNLVINPKKNSWWCGRCESGGGPALWLAVEAGILHCDEAKAGALTGGRFLEVLDYARSKGIIQDDRPQAEIPDETAEVPCDLFTKADFGYWETVFKKDIGDDGKPKTGDDGKPAIIKEEKYIFSRDMAKKALMEKMSFAIDQGGKDIRWFDGKIYQSTGDAKIRSILYNKAGDNTSQKAVAEVINRIQSDLMLEPVVFNPEPFLMPLQNGVVDLETGEIRPYEADDLFTFKYCAQYDPYGGNWRLILWQLCSTLPDPRDVLQAIDLATSVVLRVPFDVWGLLFGGGSNGKGNLEDILMGYVGPDRVSGMTLDELKASRFGAGGLLDVDLMIISEVEGVKGATNAMKKIVTGEFLDSDVKFGGRKKGRPHLLPLLDANNAFDYGDDSFGRKRRTIKMDFPYQFGYGPDERPKDPLMKEKITSPEALSGLASIIMARAPYLIESRKIYRYKSIAESEAEYDIQQYPKKHFVDSCISEVDYDDPDWKERGEGSDRLGMPDVVREYRDYCHRFNVPLSGDDRSIAQELGGYIAKVFEVSSGHTSKSEGGKVIHYRYYPGIWLKRSAASAHADHILSYPSISTTPTTLLRQQNKIEIDIREYITTPTTPTTANLALTIEDVIGEILRMFLYISSCNNPREITIEKYLENAVVSAVAVVRDHHITISTGEGDVNAVVKNPEADVKEMKVGTEIDQYLSEQARKGQNVQVSDLMRMGHSELESLEALDAAGWTEEGRGIWKPKSRER